MDGYLNIDEWVDEINNSLSKLIKNSFTNDDLFSIKDCFLIETNTKCVLINRNVHFKSKFYQILEQPVYSHSKVFK